MSTKTITGVEINVDDEGYMTDMSQWTKEVGAEIAKEEGVELTEQHYTVLEYLRNKHNSGETLSIRGINKSGVVDVKTFYQLFPGAPLKKSTKIAGIPKPVSCV